jgi:carboxymethylenebutenolidase
MRNTQRLWTAVILLPMLAAPALGQVVTKDIVFKSGDEEIKGFLAIPDGKGPFPAVVVIQEWWGLNDWIKENAKRLAAKGYVALAPDLYRGKVTDDMKVASQLVKGLPPDRALRDLQAAVKTLAAMDNVRKDRIGSIGWCMGGGYSLQLALHNHTLKACVICYGRVITDSDKLKPLAARVLGIFGEEDKGIPAKSVREFESALKKEGRKVERINIFADAGHGFMRPTNGSTKNPAYRESQAQQAWVQIEEFFAKTLSRK